MPGSQTDEIMPCLLRYGSAETKSIEEISQPYHAFKLRPKGLDFFTRDGCIAIVVLSKGSDTLSYRFDDGTVIMTGRIR